ncbi:Gfo/Idh/MocA family oxidoreductase [Solirubrobacter taibaiensis]|nr:Gfo/Idh/MocA family oxidoreductase [Solirubrobacter taibaiensis]
MSSSSLRFALIGASDIAATRVAPALRRSGHEVVAVLSSSVERGRAYADANEIPDAASDLEPLLARDDIDAVYVSTTNELHCAQVLAAAAAGKHVLCEKPLAMTLADAWSMVDACERAGVVLATNHHLPAAGTHAAIAGLVQDGAIGEPVAVRVFHAVSLPERLQGWRLTSPERGAGVALDITCHDAAAVNAILGRPALEAAAIAVSQGPWSAVAEDALMSAIRYEGDVLVQTHDAFTVPYAGSGLEVHGTEGSIIARDVMTQDPVGRIVLRTKARESSVDPSHREDLYDHTIDAFAGAIAGEGLPIVDGVAGVRALAVAIAVKEAAESGRTAQIAWQRAAAAA